MSRKRAPRRKWKPDSLPLRRKQVPPSAPGEQPQTDGLRSEARLRSNPLTEKDKELARRVASGQSLRQASKAIGMPLSTASKRMSHDQVRAYVSALMEEAGLTDRYLVEKLREGLEANRFEMTKDGTVVDLGPDNTNRVKYLDIGVKLKDWYPNPRINHEHKVSGAIVLRSEDTIGFDPFADVVEGEYSEVDDLPSG